MNTSIDERVRSKITRILEQRGIRQRELAEMIGVMPQNLNAYMTGKRGFGKKNIARIAKALDISEGSFYSDTNLNSCRLKEAKKIPILSWFKAGLWHEAVDVCSPGYADEWLAYDTQDEHAFALKVYEDSMAPEFRKEDVVIVSPSERAESGDYIVAKLGDGVTLKKMKVIDETIILKPLHPDYDDIAVSGKEKKHMRIIGKVIAKYVKY